MDATSIIFTVLIGIAILLIVYSSKVAEFYSKMVRRIALLPDMPPNAIKALFTAILGISLAWWITAVINVDWWQIIVIGLFILLIMFVLWKIESISAKRQKDYVDKVIEEGVKKGIMEVERLREEAKQKENGDAKP